MLHETFTVFGGLVLRLIQWCIAQDTVPQIRECFRGGDVEVCGFHSSGQNL